MRVDWSKGGRSYTHAGTLMRPRTVTKARDVEEGVDWLSGARDLEQTSSASYVPASKVSDGVI